MFGMNAEQVTGQVRTFVAMFSGVAAILGLTWYGAVSEAVINAIGPVSLAIGPVMYVGATIWSAVTKTKANRLASAAVVIPGVKIVLPPTPEGRALAAPGVTPDNVVVASNMTAPDGGVGGQQARRSF